MNFWEFKEDHSRGYWLPVSNDTAYRHGSALGRGFVSCVILLFKGAAVIVKGLGHLLYSLFLLLWKLKK
jgi:hypothetical protein